MFVKVCLLILFLGGCIFSMNGEGIFFSSFCFYGEKVAIHLHWFFCEVCVILCVCERECVCDCV